MFYFVFYYIPIKNLGQDKFTSISIKNIFYRLTFEYKVT
jgi:hypothetical protein